MLTNLDSPSMHFAVGMLGTLVLCIPVLVFRPNWWPLVPLAQTAGGIFALAPDWVYALVFYPSLPFSGSVDPMAVKEALHGDLGNLFFFHSAIDGTGEGNFLRGFLMTVVQYNAWLALFAIGWVVRERAHEKRRADRLRADFNSRFAAPRSPPPDRASKDDPPTSGSEA